MGEIADMMIGGEMCACGVYLDGSPSGFPFYCSKQCAKDYGGFTNKDINEAFIPGEVES